EAAQHDDEALVGWHVVHRDDVLGDRLGDRGAQQCADEVEDRGHEERRTRGEGPGGHRGRDGVRGVVEPVGVVERQGERHDDDDEHYLHGAQDSLSAMVSTVFATFSKASAACSRTSTISLSFMRRTGSDTSSNSSARSLRWTLSAWFSRRLTSTQYSGRSSMERRRGIASAVSSDARWRTWTCSDTRAGSSSTLYRTMRSAASSMKSMQSSSADARA